MVCIRAGDDISRTDRTYKSNLRPGRLLRFLGVGIVGPRAGELIAEAVLAMEMGAVLEDLVIVPSTLIQLYRKP